MNSYLQFSCQIKNKILQIILAYVYIIYVYIYIYIYIYYVYVIVKSHYEEVIVVITRVRGGAEDECNNDNLRVQWDLTGFYPIVFDVHHVVQ